MALAALPETCTDEQQELLASMTLARVDPREYIKLMISAVDGDPVHEHPLFDLYVDSLMRCLATRTWTQIIAPPEHLKSTVLRWLLVWIKAKNPRLRIGLTSADRDRSQKTLTAIRKGILSSINQQIFPHMLADASRSKERGEWNQNMIYLNGDVTDPSFEVFAFWGDVLGSRVDIWLMDDVVTQESEDSPTIREKTWRRINRTFLTRLTDSGLVFFLGNVWHREDAHHKMANSQSVHTLWIGYEGTERLYYKVLNSAPGWKRPLEGTMERIEAIWPESRLQAVYNNDPTTYRKSYGGKALSEEDMIFPPREKWKIWQPQELAPIMDQIRIYAALDPSGGKYAKHNDFAAMSAIGIDAQRRLYLLGWRCARVSAIDQAHWLWDMHDALKRAGFRLGIWQAEVEFLPKDEDWLWPEVERINAEEQAKNNSLNISAHYDNRSKPTRIHAMLKHFKHRFLAFPHDWLDQCKTDRETREFTCQIEDFRGDDREHDDAPDCLAAAIELAEREGPYIPLPIDDLQTRGLMAQYARQQDASNLITRRKPDGSWEPAKKRKLAGL